MSRVPPVSVTALLGHLLQRQWILVLRRPVQLVHPLLFFCLVVFMFPIGLGPATEVLGQFAPALLWIVALLANLIGSDSLFRDDFADGSIDQLLLSGYPLYFVVIPHLLVHWLITGVILALGAPLFAYTLAMPAVAIPTLVVSLLLGTGTLTVLGALGAALTVGLRRGGGLITLLIAPFYIPVLIFGVAAVEAPLNGATASPYLALLGAFFAASLALGPLAIGAGLRISVDG